MPRVDVLQHGRPIRTPEGAIAFCSTVLIEGDQRTLVDTGHVGRRVNLLAALAQRGLAISDIDNLVLSHAHWDHAQNLDLFPDARVLLHGDERRYASKPHVNDWATPAWTGPMLEAHSHLTEVGDGFVIEPGVTIVATPGHSPGSISVLVDTDDGVAALAGDVMHRADVALTGVNPLVFWDAEQANDSIARLLQAGDVFYPGHDLPFRLVKGEVEYLAAPPMVLGGVDPTDPASVQFTDSPVAPWVMPGIEDQTIG
jgi:N-acyl homoserine lactone hydrolase